MLRISTTYNSSRASWYEVMGIMVVWEAYNDADGIDPFSHRLDEHGAVTHGRLRENEYFGGTYSLGVNLSSFPDCMTHRVVISDFQYNPGDFSATGANHCMPTIRQGQRLTFVNDDASPLSPGNPLDPSLAYMASIFHTVTSCQNPCGLNTGISYPLANGAGGFDSGQLGLGIPATGKLSWSTSAKLPPGHLHVLLPDPPLDARGVPDHQRHRRHLEPGSAAARRGHWRKFPRGRAFQDATARPERRSELDVPSIRRPGRAGHACPAAREASASASAARRRASTFPSTTFRSRTRRRSGPPTLAQTMQIGVGLNDPDGAPSRR